MKSRALGEIIAQHIISEVSRCTICLWVDPRRIMCQLSQSMPNKQTMAFKTHLPAFTALLLVFFDRLFCLFLFLRLGWFQRRRPGHRQGSGNGVSCLMSWCDESASSCYRARRRKGRRPNQGKNGNEENLEKLGHPYFDRGIGSS